MERRGLVGGDARGRDVHVPVRPAQRVHARLVHRLDRPIAPPASPSSTAAPPPPRDPGALIATVRSNYTIDVKTPAGQKVDTVKPGPYTIEVRDQSNEHNFRLQGQV